jgi:hypothetical protein
MQLKDALLVGPVIGALLACGYGSDRDHHDMGGSVPVEDPQEQPETPGIPRSQIDTDATLTEIVAGQGAGVFVEYKSGGNWRIRTTCDTAISGSGCVWDIILTSLSGTVNSFVKDDLEPQDWLGRENFDGVRMIASNDFGIDGVNIDATEGAAARIDVFLDGRPGNRYIYWVGGSGLHRGAPDNPVDLTPNAP